MKRLLIVSLLLIGASSANAAVDPKVHKLCAKAADYVGCVKLNSANNENSDTSRQQGNSQKERLIAELRKLGARIKNSSLSTLSENTREFRDALALSNAESVGEELYKNAKTIDYAIDQLRRYWSNTIESKYITTDCKVTKATADVYNIIFKGLSVQVYCSKTCGLFGCSEVGQDITYKLAQAIEEASNMLAERGVFSFPPITTENSQRDCAKQPNKEMFNKCMAGG
jgi:hypothetical protein